MNLRLRSFQWGRRRAAVLLEVILALVLLVAAAAIIGAGLSSSIDAVERQRLNLHALNLAVSVATEAQLGLRAPGHGPEAFETPFEHWTWEMQVAAPESELAQSGSLSLVEVIIRHDDPVLVHRLAEVIELGRAHTGSETPATHATRATATP